MQNHKVVSDSVVNQLKRILRELSGHRKLPPYLSEHCIPVSTADTRRHLRSANRHLLVVLRFGSTLTAVGRSQLLARWPGTHSRILSGIQRAAQTVLGVYLKRTCSRVTSASGALGVLNDYALYKSTHSLTHSRHYLGYLRSSTLQNTRCSTHTYHSRRLKFLLSQDRVCGTVYGLL